MRKRTNKPEVYSITGARSGLSDDVSDRTRRYLISMSIRTACVIGAVVTHGPLRWLLVLGAVGLPYVAVIMANAGRESGTPDQPEAIAPEGLPGLTPGGSAPPRP